MGDRAPGGRAATLVLLGILSIDGLLRERDQVETSALGARLRSHCDVQLSKRLTAVDEHPATRGERGSDARDRRLSCVRMATVERAHRLREAAATRSGGTARLYVRKYRQESPSGELEVHSKWQRRWEDDWRKARQQAAAAVDAIIDDLGEQPGYSRTALELTVQMHLLRPNEVGMFTPW